MWGQGLVFEGSSTRRSCAGLSPPFGHLLLELPSKFLLRGGNLALRLILAFLERLLGGLSIHAKDKVRDVHRLRLRIGLIICGENASARAEVNRELVAPGPVIVPLLLRGGSIAGEHAVGRTENC